MWDGFPEMWDGFPEMWDGFPGLGPVPEFQSPLPLLAFLVVNPPSRSGILVGGNDSHDFRVVTIFHCALDGAADFALGVD